MFATISSQKKTASNPSLSSSIFRVTLFALAFLLLHTGNLHAQVIGPVTPQDPGPRGGTVNAGNPLSTLNASQLNFFNDGLDRFKEIDSVNGMLTNEAGVGLGPRFNSNGCATCHAQPAVGGTSPSQRFFPFIGPNPQPMEATLDGAHNTVPSFISAAGPVREARFKFFLNPDNTLSTTADGGVHDLFTISGRTDAGTCNIQQPDFATNLQLNNVSFRIPSPTFGGGLIENIAEETIINNMLASSADKQTFGISGHPNRNGNDGTITRFGWKAQNKSLEIFSGEAYNVEQGVTNELFQNERPSPGELPGLPANCKLNGYPEDHTNTDSNTLVGVPSDAVQFALFMRFLDQPTPSPDTPGGAASIASGKTFFVKVGCSLCHTPSLQTDTSSLTTGLDHAQANLYSDLLVHHMGKNLDDGIMQGNAGTDEFRTAPLWGVGQRLFFLHDGRSTDLLDAINQHASAGSEANEVIKTFNAQGVQKRQDILNFLRSL